MDKDDIYSTEYDGVYCQMFFLKSTFKELEYKVHLVERWNFVVKSRRIWWMLVKYISQFISNRAKVINCIY